MMHAVGIDWETIVLLCNDLENCRVSMFSYREHNLIHLCLKL